MSKKKNPAEESYKFFSVRKENQNTSVQHNFRARNRDEAIEKFDRDWLKYFTSDLDIKTTVHILDSEPKLWF